MNKPGSKETESRHQEIVYVPYLKLRGSSIIVLLARRDAYEALIVGAMIGQLVKGRLISRQ